MLSSVGLAGPKVDDDQIDPHVSYATELAKQVNSTISYLVHG